MAAPKTPTPDASEGVAIPSRMIPMTAKINRSGGTTDFITIDTFWRAELPETSSLLMAGQNAGFTVMIIF
jgi:hypothetical protein